MRRIIFAVAAFVAVAFAAAPASAQDYPYCLQGRDYGYPGLCHFTSYWQCEATASGTFSYCGTGKKEPSAWISPVYAGRRPATR
jgi:hypothetical protein